MQLMQPSEYVSEFIMTRVQQKSFVLIEGTTDRALWMEYTDDDCRLYPTKGKDIIIDVLNTPFLRDMPGIAGIVDADYWLVTEANELDMENLLYDDSCPDMESLLLNSPALKKVLRNNLYNYDVEKLHAFAEKVAREAQRIAAEFGYFRLLNHLNDYRLSFKSIRFDEVIDSATLELDCKWVARRLAENLSDITSEQLLREIDDLREEYPADNPQLCRGKDVVAIIAFILPILFQREFDDELPAAAIAPIYEMGLAKDLRMAYEFGYFMRTSLYSCIRSWECANEPYRIIRADI